MSNIFNEDFKEFISILNKQKVEYILVGGYSVILHGYNRTTGDMDIWVNKTPENHKRLLNSCNEFGLMTQEITPYNFLENDSIDVFTFGRPPVSIDIMKQVKGLNFEDTYRSSLLTEIEDIQIRLIHKNHLIMAKKASNRPKDQDDVMHLEDSDR